MDVRLEIPPCPIADVLALERELGVSFALGQVLVRRGLRDPALARAWLDAADEHDPAAFAGIDAAVELVLEHAQPGQRITVHGDYDVDGVCSTAILVRALRALGAQADWFLPSRSEDGYGLSAATVERLVDRGTTLLITADCAITAVDEVAAARAAGLAVVVTDHHMPRADGVLPAAPIVHPLLSQYPCPDLCAAGVAYKFAAAFLAAAGLDPAGADEDVDLVALATVADCVPLRGENRRLVRAGLAALSRTVKPGLRALMRVAEADPAHIDERAIGFRLAPRINAAGRMGRADAGLELVLTQDDERAAEIAAELDRLNAERRHTETRILFAAEAQLGEQGERSAYVLWGDDWHPGVIGIVASRIAERRHRPALLIALDGDTGTGSGRSIPAFDLLAALDECSPQLLRHGGHRAAAGCSVARDQLEALRAAFTAHAGAVLNAEDMIPVERVDAVVAGDELGTTLAEELQALAPFGQANPGVSLLVPAARLVDPRPMGDGKHLRFMVEAGGVRARAVAFGTSRLAEGADVAVDATFALELNEWGGAVEPRLVLRRVAAPAAAAATAIAEPGDYRAAVLAELDAELDPWPPVAPVAQSERVLRDRRGGGVAGTIGALVAAGEPVLVVCADVERREAGFAGRLGGFALCSWRAFENAPELAAPYSHVVALDPPAHAHQRALLEQAPGAGTAHLAWGEAELRFARNVHDELHQLRAPLAAAYRALRDDGADLESALRGPGARQRPAAVAGRVLRVLAELGLVSLERAAFTASVPPAQRTELEASAAFRAYETRRLDGERWLSGATAKAA